MYNVIAALYRPQNETQSGDVLLVDVNEAGMGEVSIVLVAAAPMELPNAQLNVNPRIIGYFDELGNVTQLASLETIRDDGFGLSEKDVDSKTLATAVKRLVAQTLGLDA